MSNRMNFGATLSRPRVPLVLRTRGISTRATIDDRQAAVAQKLLHLEGELAFITQPGRIPPRAAVVAGIRKEISALRSELANPGTMKDLDLTLPANTRTTSTNSTASGPSPTRPVAPVTEPPAPIVQSAGSKAASNNVKKASGARNALLEVEKKLGRRANAAPLSEKAKIALDAIEGNMSTMLDASRNLNEFESLQVENALLRTRLEVVMERKRHLSQLRLAAVRGGLLDTEKDDTRKAERSKVNPSQPEKSAEQSDPVNGVVLVSAR